MHLSDSEVDSCKVLRLSLKSTDCPDIRIQKEWKERETVERNKEIVHHMPEGEHHDKMCQRHEADGWRLKHGKFLRHKNVTKPARDFVIIG